MGWGGLATEHEATREVARTQMQLPMVQIDCELVHVPTLSFIHVIQNIAACEKLWVEQVETPLF